MVTADSLHVSLFGADCRVNDVLVIIFFWLYIDYWLLLNKYWLLFDYMMGCMLHVEWF